MVAGGNSIESGLVTTFVVPTLEPPFKLQEDRIRSELRLERKAQEEGRHNKPGADETELDETESEIANRSQSGITRLSQISNSNLATLMTALRTTLSVSTDNQFFAVAERFIGDAKTLLDSQKRELVRARMEERQAYRDFRFFQQLHKRTGRAVYPESKILAFAILLIIVAFESVANSALFAKGSDLGILGGWFQAILIAGLNALVSFLAGVLILRNINHVFWWRKFGAILLLGLYLCVAIAFNLLVAHYRVLLEITPDAAVAEAFNRFVTRPFDIANLEAVLLLVAGFAACVVSAWDGCAWLDDPYPGYGRASRLYQGVLEKYDALEQETLRKLENLRDAALADIDRRLAAVRSTLDYRGQLLHLIWGEQNTYRTSTDAITRGFHNLLKEYRSANEKVRTAPSPKYFEHFPNLNIPNLDTIRDADEEQLAVIKEQTTAIDVAAAKARAQVIDAFKNTADRMPEVIKESSEAALELIKENEEFAKAV